MLNELIKIREELHKVPELGFQEFETSKIIKKYLTSYGYECISIAKTGVLVIKHGEDKNAIAFRSDMDGIATLENTGLEFSSENKGIMHACGHDAHMTILLGFAKHISQLENIKQTIAFIFQPAEEGPGGAKVIVDEGILEKYNIKSIIGLHVYPELEQGIIGINEGYFMAQDTEIRITIKGKGGHAAMPHLGTDCIYVASHLIQAYHSIISRNIDPQETAVVSLGTIQGGESLNSMAREVKLAGNVRTFEPEVLEGIKKRMLEINEGLQKMFNIKIDFEFQAFYPAVYNDKNLFKNIVNALDPEKVKILKKLMISEDFSYYQQKIPGAFMMFGVRNKNAGCIHPLHSNKFNFDPKIMQQAIDTYIRICEHMQII